MFQFIMYSEISGQSKGVEFHIKKQSFKAGDEVVVDIHVNGFQDICAFQWAMGWDKNYLKLETITGHPLLNYQKNYWNVVNESVFITAWLNPLVTGVTIPENDILVTMTFKAAVSGSIENMLKLIDQSILTSSEFIVCGGNALTLLPLTFFYDVISYPVNLAPTNSADHFIGGGDVLFQKSPDTDVQAELIVSDLMGRVRWQGGLEDFQEKQLAHNLSLREGVYQYVIVNKDQILRSGTFIPSNTILK